MSAATKPRMAALAQCATATTVKPTSAARILACVGGAVSSVP
jgi:hypothetical protein